MVAANLARVETLHPADAMSDPIFLRGLLYGLAFSVPLWAAIVAVVQLIF